MGARIKKSRILSDCAFGTLVFSICDWSMCMEKYICITMHFYENYIIFVLVSDFHIPAPKILTRFVCLDLTRLNRHPRDL